MFDKNLTVIATRAVACQHCRYHMAAHALGNHQFHALRLEQQQNLDGDVKTIQKVWSVCGRQGDLNDARILLTHWEPMIGIERSELIQLLLAQ